MVASKGMMVFFLRALLVCSLMVTTTSVNEIGYGAMQHGGIPNYKPPTQANPYSRGCLATTKCRTGGAMQHGGIPKYKPPTPANPYTRGCLATTKCRADKTFAK
ncbi:hypothetical protein Vadar_029990 [Vaccinium darrowii]|uniref:Uncharacterized protein n=1 Tax=Vaccinium darrowii TaxID=229202 RepID=A0ACB7XU84_9ERIC|nr:hypothetical protein Vadar_029990 [Vaccinium darrowii]